MHEDSQGGVYSYYGTFNIKEKRPKLGVTYFMLNEHVKRMVNIEKEKFLQEITKIISNFNKSLKDTIKKNSDEMKGIHLRISDINKFMFKLIDINKLETPEIEKKSKSKTKAKPKDKPKIEEEIEYEDENEDNGYL